MASMQWKKSSRKFTQMPCQQHAAYVHRWYRNGTRLLCISMRLVRHMPAELDKWVTSLCLPCGRWRCLCQGPLVSEPHPICQLGASEAFFRRLAKQFSHIVLVARDVIVASVILVLQQFHGPHKKLPIVFRPNFPGFHPCVVLRR